MRIEKWRENLILDHMWLVEKILPQVYRKLTHVDRDDLRQAGHVGLVEAAIRYKPPKGVFEHYAYKRIRGAMIDAHKRRAYRDETHYSLDSIGLRPGSTSLAWDMGPLPDEIVARREHERLMAGAIRMLTPDEQRVFAAALRSESLAETARECGWSDAWARATQASARATMQAWFHRWGLGGRFVDRAAAARPGLS